MSFLLNLLCLQVKTAFFPPLSAPRTRLVPGSWSHLHPASANTGARQAAVPTGPTAQAPSTPRAEQEDALSRPSMFLTAGLIEIPTV